MLALVLLSLYHVVFLVLALRRLKAQDEICEIEDVLRVCAPDALFSMPGTYWERIQSLWVTDVEVFLPDTTDFCTLAEDLRQNGISFDIGPPTRMYVSNKACMYVTTYAPDEGGVIIVDA